MRWAKRGNSKGFVEDLIKGSPAAMLDNFASADSKIRFCDGDAVRKYMDTLPVLRVL